MDMDQDEAWEISPNIAMFRIVNEYRERWDARIYEASNVKRSRPANPYEISCLNDRRDWEAIKAMVPSEYFRHVGHGTDPPSTKNFRWRTTGSRTRSTIAATSVPSNSVGKKRWRHSSKSTLTNLDSAITGYAENSFATFAGPIATVCQSMGVVGVAFIALNALTQWVPIRVSEYLKWGMRYVIVTAVATSWAQFLPIYKIVTNTPGALGAELMGIVGAPNLNTAFDAMITTLFDFSDTLADEASMFSISMASIVVWIIGGLMAAAAIIVIALGKIGLAMAIALAPIFIPALMFRATSNLFESWVRFTIGFALIPLVMAGVVGAVVGIGQAMIGDGRSLPPPWRMPRAFSSSASEPSS